MVCKHSGPGIHGLGLGLGHFSIYPQDYFLKNIVTDLKYAENGAKVEYNIAGAKLALPKKVYNNFPPSSG